MEPLSKKHNPRSNKKYVTCFCIGFSSDVFFERSPPPNFFLPVLICAWQFFINVRQCWLSIFKGATNRTFQSKVLEKNCCAKAIYFSSAVQSIQSIHPSIHPIQSNPWYYYTTAKQDGRIENFKKLIKIDKNLKKTFTRLGKKFVSVHQQKCHW